MSDRIEKPFSEYKNFDDCVTQNSDKADPAAYCGEIRSRTEKEYPCKEIQLLKSDDGHFYIYGPASVEIVDKEKDRIRASALEVSLPQLLRRGRLSLSHQDVIVGEILPELTLGGTTYRTAVFKDRLMVLGDVWDDTEASQETRARIQRKELKSYSISGMIRKGGAARVCDSGGCYRDIFKLDSHAVTICEEGMNPAARFEVLQKDAGVVQLIPISPPDSYQQASPKEAEVHKNMADETKPPATEAKKEDGAPPAPAGGGVEATLKEMMGMMQKMMSMMGGGGQVAAAQKAAESAPPAAVTKEDIDKMIAEKVEAGIKKGLEDVLKGTSIVQTPRPDQISKEQIDNSPIHAIIRDPSRLDKMSFKELAELEA